MTEALQLVPPRTVKSIHMALADHNLHLFSVINQTSSRISYRELCISSELSKLKVALETEVAAFSFITYHIITLYGKKLSNYKPLFLDY